MKDSTIWMVAIYAFIILTSIYTTAISIGMSFIDNITTTIKTSYSLIVLIMCITSFGISGFGFSNLVANLYPFFGYLGIVQIWLLLKIHPQKDELSKGQKGRVKMTKILPKGTDVLIIIIALGLLHVLQNLKIE